MDLMTTLGHTTILAALLSGIRVHLRLERNGNAVPKLRFKIWFDRGKD